MNEAPALCTLLPWDSDFFGVRIGRVWPETLSETDVAAAAAWARTERVDCLYALADSGDAATLGSLAAGSFAELDARLTLARDADLAVGMAPTPDPVHIRRATGDDLGALEALARISHHNTRFYLDGRFARDRCDELYAIWISQALTADHALALVADAGSGLAGYVSLHDLDKVEARIALTAVAAEHRGQGIGQALCAAALREAAAHGAQRVSVVTQGRRPEAVGLYERVGFRTRRSQIWHHAWLR